jgi:hypothetical protein
VLVMVTRMAFLVVLRQLNSGVRHASHQREAKSCVMKLRNKVRLEWFNSSGGLTTHSTEARVSHPLIVELAIARLNARPVNSGVRLYL